MKKVHQLHEKNKEIPMNSKVNIRLAKAIVLILIEGHEPVYKTKLNKLLFYAQFLYAKKYKEDLLGKSFIKDYYGPAIDDLDYELKVLEGQGIISLNNNGYGTLIYPRVKFKSENYTPQEREVLQMVAKKFKGVNVNEIIEISHKEPLWIDTPLKQVISLDKAEELVEFVG